MEMTIVNLAGASVDARAAVLPTTGGVRLRARRFAADAPAGRGFGLGAARIEHEPTFDPALDVTSDPTS